LEPACFLILEANERAGKDVSKTTRGEKKSDPGEKAISLPARKVPASQLIGRSGRTPRLPNHAAGRSHNPAAREFVRPSGSGNSLGDVSRAKVALVAGRVARGRNGGGGRRIGRGSSTETEGAHAAVSVVEGSGGGGEGGRAAAGGGSRDGRGVSVDVGG
jgi:hypothetical protein